MQFHFLEENYDKMIEIYPRLVESVVEFRVFHRKVIAERKGETYEINPEHETCPLAKGYQIVKIADYQYKCEILEDQNQNKDEKVKEEENKMGEEYEEGDNEEIEQLDQDSEQHHDIMKDDPLTSEIDQANEKEYIKSIQIEKKLEDENPISNNQRENYENKQQEPKIVKNDIENKLMKENPLNKSEDSVKINLDLNNNSGKEKISPHFVNIKTEDSNIIVSSNSHQKENPATKEELRKSEHTISQPVLQIENEEADKIGGMCSCSK